MAFLLAAQTKYSQPATSPIFFLQMKREERHPVGQITLVLPNSRGPARALVGRVGCSCGGGGIKWFGGFWWFDGWFAGSVDHIGSWRHCQLFAVREVGGALRVGFGLNLHEFRKSFGRAQGLLEGRCILRFRWFTANSIPLIRTETRNR